MPGKEKRPQDWRAQEQLLPTIVSVRSARCLLKKRRHADQSHSIGLKSDNLL